MKIKLSTYATLKRKLRDIIGLLPVGCTASSLSLSLSLLFIGFILAAPIPTAYPQSTSVLTGSLRGASGNESISNYESVAADTVSADTINGGAISADTISATSTIRAATFIFSASEIPLYVGDTTTSDSGKALIYDATSNAINLLPITDYLDFAAVGSSLNFGDISDVSVEWASEGWVPAWNAVDEIWEATPAAEYTPSITESEVATMIQSATESLTPSEIGAADTATMNTAIETAVNNATSTLTLDELDNVSLSGKSDGDVIYWDAGAEVWSATPQVTGGTGGTGETFDPSTLRIPYIVSVTYLGSPAAVAKMLYHAVPRSVTFAAGLTDSQAICETVATAETTFSIRKNNTEFGTVTFAIGSTTGTFAAASQTVFTTGDILSIVAPDPADDTLAQIGITLLGEQGVIE